MTTARRIGVRLLALGFLCLVPRPAPLVGQEVQWRTDYAAARREAAEKDRPLVIDFGTENCFWCKQLDLRTFRDVAVVRALNERFVPLKIDAQREPELTSRLRIQTFPTIVLAAPDGKILDTIEGFREATPFQEYLQRALASVAPEWMARNLQEATRAIGAAEYARAAGLLQKIVEDKKDRPVQVKARQLLQELEQQAAARLAQARQQAERGDLAEAHETLRELARAFAGTAAAAEAEQMLTVLAARPEPRARRARELLAQAREDFRLQQYLGCLERCEQLTAQYSDLPEATQALQLAEVIKNNPEWMRQACDTLSERLGLLYLSLAETWLRNGQPHQAVLCLERVVQAFPNTRHAEAAQSRLLQIQGQLTRPVDFQDP
jgi:thioredoxin-like negative regulator of GroEL